jgi:hypothetical protein
VDEENTQEKAFARARREYQSFVTSTVRFVIWFALVNVLVVGSTTYLSWGHKRGGQVAIGVGALVAGSILAFVLPLALFWLAAPVRQRNEARTLLQDARARLAERPSFPRIRYKLDQGAHVAGVEDATNQPNEAGLRVPMRLVLRPIVSNLEEHTISLSFWVAASKIDGTGELHQLLAINQQPINLAARHGERLDLQFYWLGMPFEDDADAIFKAGPLAGNIALTLHIEEHNTGATLAISPFDEYPAEEEVANY